MGVAEKPTFTIRDALADMVEKQEEKLQAVESRHPEGWGGDTVLSLFSHADERMDRLSLAVDAGEDDMIGRYAVDVANYMMMLADNAGSLHEKYGK